MSISKKFLRSLVSKISVVKLLKNKLEFIQLGEYYRCNCPFCPDAYNNFAIHPFTNFYYCFKCQHRGDAITYFMDFENLDYYASIIRLCEITETTVPESVKKQYKNRLQYLSNL